MLWNKDFMGILTLNIKSYKLQLDIPILVQCYMAKSCLHLSNDCFRVFGDFIDYITDFFILITFIVMDSNYQNICAF